MHIFRYGIAVDLEDLMEAKSPFYDIYDLKSEWIPTEEEWALRMKEVMPGQDQQMCIKSSEEESIEEEDWAEEVNVEVTTTTKASILGSVENDEQKGRDLKKLLDDTKEEL